eukprot:gene13460-13575_t
MNDFFDDPDLLAVLSVFNQNGEETRVIGGAVRNLLLDLPVADIDLATTALPQKSIALAKAQHWRAIPTGFEHGTITVLLNGKSFEITTLRQDLTTDGRHAEVKFGRDFAADAQRRDFTINALSRTIDGRIHDYTHGQDDIKAGRIRFIGTAKTRIREDYLRILRFFRFSATYAKQFDAEAIAAISETREGLRQLSKERVADELFKILLAPRAGEALMLMNQLALIPILLGGAGDVDRLNRLIALEHQRQSQPDALLRLAAFSLHKQEDAHRLRTLLRLSNDAHNRLLGMNLAIQDLNESGMPPDLSQLKEFLFHHGRQAALDGLSLAQCASPIAADAAGWAAAYQFLVMEPEPKLPFSGADLLARGLPPGPSMGIVLKKLQAAWIRAGFPRDPQTLNALLDQALS